MLSNHVTLINDNIGRVPPEAMPQLEKLARRAGYRLVLREVAHDRTVKRGATVAVQMKWANAGVGKLYRPALLRLLLLDGQGQPVCSADTKADPRLWLPGEFDLMESFAVPATVVPGEYTLAATLLDPAGDHGPFRLAMDAPEKEGRYSVSRLVVE